jgi:hypothetical protein
MDVELPARWADEPARLAAQGSLSNEFTALITPAPWMPVAVITAPEAEPAGTAIETTARRVLPLEPAA